MAGEGPLALGGCGCCLIVAVALIVYLACSFKTVNQTDWCLKYDFWSESVTEVISQPGMKFIGMGNYLLCYPNTNKYVYFRNFPERGLGVSIDDDNLYLQPVVVRTRDGLNVNIELEFVYKFRMRDLETLYLLAGEKDRFFNHLHHLSEGIIDNFATNFTAVEFFNNRTQVSDLWLRQLTEQLGRLLYIDVQSLQLQPAHFPREYSDVIDRTQEHRQDIEVARQERQSVLIQKQTELQAERTLAGRLTIQAEAEAQRILYDNEAQVSQYLLRQRLTAEGYNHALQFFSGDKDVFMDYLNVAALNQHSPDVKTVRVAATAR